MWAYACGVISAGSAIEDRTFHIIGGILLAGPLICGASQAVNDWFDRHVDAINEPWRVIPSGRMPGRWGLWIAIINSLLSLAVAALLGTYVFIAAIIGIVLAWAYSMPPVRLKANGWYGNAAVGISYETLPWLTAAAAALGTAPSMPVFIAALAYGIGAHGIMTLNDFKAMEGDRKMGINSLPVMLGADGAARLACIVMAVPQAGVVALLVQQGRFVHAAAVGLLLAAQACLHGPLPARSGGPGGLVQRHRRRTLCQRHDGNGIRIAALTRSPQGGQMARFASQEGLGWLAIMRLGLVQAALGSVVVLTTSTLNRVMVVELALAAAIPGALVGLHYAVQLLRPVFGHRSDMGGGRTAWILGGMAVLAIAGTAASATTLLFERSFLLGLSAAIVAYAFIGFGIGACGTSLLALLASRTRPQRRPAAATIVWMMMVAGIVITAIVTGSLLDPYSHSRLVAVTAGVGARCLPADACRNSGRRAPRRGSGRGAAGETRFPPQPR